ncbi:Uncharacterized protein FWK35_00028837, partial [Aphis craccivora]
VHSPPNSCLHPENRKTACRVFHSVTKNVHRTALRSHALSDRARSGQRFSLCASLSSDGRGREGLSAAKFLVLTRAAMVPFVVLTVICSAYLFVIGPGSSEKCDRDFRVKVYRHFDISYS